MSGSIEDQVKSLQNILIARATGEETNSQHYEYLRKQLINSIIAPVLPEFIRNCRTLGEFWGFIKGEFSTYDDRREFIRERFRPVFEQLEQSNSPVMNATSTALGILNIDHVSLAWQRSLERVKSEPDSAITSAKTMLESLYKVLLDEQEVKYPETANLPKLQHLVMMELKFSPEQQTDDNLRVIAGNIKSIQSQLASLRNSISDSHGHGKNHYQPSVEIAEFVVNISGALAILIVRLYQQRHVSG